MAKGQHAEHLKLLTYLGVVALRSVATPTTWANTSQTDTAKPLNATLRFQALSKFPVEQPLCETMFRPTPTLDHDLWCRRVARLAAFRV